MKYLLILCCLIGYVSSSVGQSDVTIVVENIKSIKGNLLICLTDNKADFLENCQYEAKVKVSATTEITLFEGLTHGSYAVSIFHDKNEDGKLSTNFVGIPKEPYGFSNNPFAMFGPPSFNKCLVEVNQDSSITIKL